MIEKIACKKILALGLISTSFALTNIELASSKSELISEGALKVNIGSSANAGVCNSRCAKRLVRIGGKAIESFWPRRREQEQQ